MPQLLLRRVARRATAPLRPLPSVLVIGGIRSGSTSVDSWLKANGFAGPLPPRRKELHFFDQSFDRGANWYRSSYPLRPAGPTIDSTPAYLCLPECPGRAAAIVPEAKIVVILREPLARAHSHFAWREGKGVEQEATLADALADEPRRLAVEPSRLGCYGLHSRYEVGLSAWLEHFPADQVCVLIAERVFAGEEAELQRLRTFLDHRLEAPFPHANAGPAVRPGPPLRTRGGPFASTITAVEDLLGRPTGWGAG